MKLEKFHELCKSKWDDGRGDVRELHLREDSRDELWQDILVNRDRPVSVLNIFALLNPVTRSEVTIKTTNGLKDFVLVYYKAGWKEKADIDDISDP